MKSRLIVFLLSLHPASSIIMAAVLLMATSAQAQKRIEKPKTNVPVMQGKYKASWEGTADWECPEWFEDVKFGIWAHWGPQCQAEQGDWYARFMYYEDENGWFNRTYGTDKSLGFKEVCRDWKAEQWNPAYLIERYYKAGARYFMTLGQHHDNMDLWDSPYQPWNTVNMGPKRDIVKGWQEECKKYGLYFGVSMHGAHAWTWLEKSQDRDGNLTKEDGKGKWWEGYDPQDLYAQQHTPSQGWQDRGRIHSQWHWEKNTGVSMPSQHFMQQFQNRVLQCINDYTPDMLYFDDTVLPFYGADDQYGLNILQHYYNHSAALHDGEQQVVVMGKMLNESQKESVLWDVERGVPDKIQPKHWQTCTCIGQWHYQHGVNYKSPDQVIAMLVDIVSKNGNLLLSIPIRGNGTIDEREEKVIDGIAAWMQVNSRSIYGTRPWKTFGEGPLAESSQKLNDQGFNEGNNYSSKDVRYVIKGDTLFATILRWPDTSTFTFKSLGYASEYYSGNVKSVELLGYGVVPATKNLNGLTVTLPGTRPNKICPVFAITFSGEGAMSHKDLMKLFGQEVKALKKQVGPNTGQVNADEVQHFEAALKKAKTILKGTGKLPEQTLTEIRKAYSNLQNNAVRKADVPAAGGTDLTASLLGANKNFPRQDANTTSRFGTPKNWTVENFRIPCGRDGVKNGLDKNPGYDCLMLGVWDDRQRAESDLTNARIYKKVHLKPGRYYFGASYETHYNLSDDYIFVSDRLLPNADIPAKAICHWPISQSPKDAKTLSGITFEVKKEGDYYLGFQANLADGSTQQEFRANKVMLRKY